MNFWFCKIVGTYARNNAPVGAKGPFCLKTLGKGQTTRGRYSGRGGKLPEVVSPDQALKTGTQVGVTVVLAQFDLSNDQKGRNKSWI